MPAPKLYYLICKNGKNIKKSNSTDKKGLEYQHYYKLWNG